MLEDCLPNISQIELNSQLMLKAQIQTLNNELNTIEQETQAFEARLRAILIDLIIEEQELNDLYRRMQKAKKQKRLEQKKRGKNYKEPQPALRKTKSEPASPESKEIDKEKKRLYREAMLHVHPDKFSTNKDKIEIDLATEVTSKLIDIYRSGSLQELQLYHAHIFYGNALLQSPDSHHSYSNTVMDDSYLKHEKEELKQKLAQAKKRPTYRVLKDYENPMLFAEELKAYYTDRLFKLKKRTRKVRV
jgi:beta-glucosidase-like glycosyl hydrolase